MDRIFLIRMLFGLFLVIRLGCSTQKIVRAEIKTDQAKTGHEWILGSWIRTNDDTGQVTYEHWEKESDSTYMGLGCTLVEGDTVFKENMTLIAERRLEVTGVGEDGPVIFAMIEFDDRSFVVENSKNKYPKRIHYRKTKMGMEAVISGGGKERAFVFVPIHGY